MSVLALEQLDAERAIALTRHWHGGQPARRLRLVTADQAPVVRAATEADRSRDLLPKWQCYGDGHHEWLSPRAYSTGRRWVRTRTLTAATPGGARQWRVQQDTGRPHINWRSRDHWLDTVVPAAVREHPEALRTRRGTITAARFQQWAREVSKFAHRSTGRRCIVRVDRLAELLGVSKATVQRAQLAAEELGLYVVMEPGRMLTEAETFAVRMRGSRQRGLANDAALVVPDYLQPPQATASPGGHDTPTSGGYSKSERYLYLVPSGSHKRSARKNEPASPARRRQGGAEPNPSGPLDTPRSSPRTPRRRSYDPEGLHLARGLVEALPWLRNTPPGRLEPMLRKYAHAQLRWTALDVVAAIDHKNARLGRASMTSSHVQHPPALLAHYLRDLDPDADHPRFDLRDDPNARAEPMSPRRRWNLQQLALHRAGHGGRAADAAAVARWAEQIRNDLDGRRERRADPSP